MLIASSSSISFTLLDKAKLLPFNPMNGSSAKINRVVVQASMKCNNRPVLSAVFEPFKEVKTELLLIPTSPHASPARHKYTDQCEEALNAQIK